MYVSHGIKGNECPRCGKVFTWSEGRNKKHYFSMELDCPRCGVRLRNPKALTKITTYIKVILPIIAFFSLLPWLGTLHRYLEISIGLVLFGAIIWWIRTSFGIRGGLVKLEVVE